MQRDVMFTRTHIHFLSDVFTVVIIRRGWLSFLVTSVEPRYVPRTKRDDYLTTVLQGRIYTPPAPPEMTCGFLIPLVFCEKKKLCGLLVLPVEQETSAPPPKKNP